MNLATELLLPHINEYILKYTSSNESDSSSTGSCSTSDVHYSIKETNDRICYSYEEPEKPQTKTDYSEGNSFSSAIRAFSRNSDISALSRLVNQSTQNTFVDRVYYYVRQKNLKESSVYKAAGIDRRLYSKIISDKYYKPSKDTVIAIAFGLCLTLDETNDLLNSAGYSISHSIKRDIVIEYFLIGQLYNIDLLNSVLFELNEKTIG